MEGGKNLDTAKMCAPDKENLEVYKQFASQTNSIEINQNQIKAAIKNMNKVQIFERQIIGNFEGTMYVTMELDIKSLVRHQQTVKQIQPDFSPHLSSCLKKIE
jgi:hypothetical protein